MFVKGHEYVSARPAVVNNTFKGVSDPSVFRKKEQARHLAIAQMSIAGYTNIEIAKGMGLNPMTVCDLLRQPYVQVYMKEQAMEFGDNMQQQIIAEGKAAFARAVKLATNAPSDKIKADLNKYLIDRYLGRAVQPIENISKPVEDMSDEELRKALPALLKESSRAPSLDPEARSDSETPAQTDSGLSAPEARRDSETPVFISSPVEDFILDGESPQTSTTE